VQLINYLTAPNCVIWSALLASAAVPGMLSPVVLRMSIANLKVVLMMKTKTGRVAPYNFGHKVFYLIQTSVELLVERRIFEDRYST
jgi:hypothetical protein